MSFDHRSTSALLLQCQNCNNKLIFDRCMPCEHCRKIKYLCQCNICELDVEVCFSCEFWNSQSQSTKSSSSKSLGTYYVFMAVLASFFVYWIYNFFPSVTPDKDILSKLRKKYPLQENDTWYDFLSVLENKVPTVKSIIFLHGEDKTTSNCLVKELVNLFSSDKTPDYKDIYFSYLGYDPKDYGLVLEHYRPIVKKFRVLVTDLTPVTGNIARIFHWLCDEVSSDIKPSLFIFTLKYEKRMESLKPFKRALAILKEAWQDLPENEIHPLLSRVVKIVIDVVPDKKVSC